MLEIISKYGLSKKEAENLELLAKTMKITLNQLIVRIQE